MILKRFFEESLAHASYLVGCPGAGEALVIDPGRDVGLYLDAAASEGLKIAAVSETHIHADLLSGSRELTARTGARLYLSDEGDADWKYAVDRESWSVGNGEIVLVHDGDEIAVGSVRIQVRHTPGHTPEHISFILTDCGTSPDPAMVFTGDFVFVGDVGRPDLLENAAGIKGTMEPSARSLFDSLTKFKKLPSHLLLWPAHGAGSACGKSLGGVPVSTLGYEMRSNWALRAASREEFVREVLSGQPEPPTYFATMKRMNKEGPALLSTGAAPAQIEQFPRDAKIVDIRVPHEFARRHAPGSTNHPLYKNFVNWAGWLLPYDRDLHLISDSSDDVKEAVRRLSLIGLDRVVSWSGPEILDQMPETESYHQGSFKDGISSDSVLLDVRNRAEWEEGHVPGAVHIPLGYLGGRLAELPRSRTIAVYCQSGGRSPIAASVLQAAGVRDVIDLEDGFEGYSRLKR